MCISYETAIAKRIDIITRKTKPLINNENYVNKLIIVSKLNDECISLHRYQT